MSSSWVSWSMTRLSVGICWRRGGYFYTHVYIYIYVRVWLHKYCYTLIRVPSCICHSLFWEDINGDRSWDMTNEQCLLVWSLLTRWNVWMLIFLHMAMGKNPARLVKKKSMGVHPHTNMVWPIPIRNYGKIVVCPFAHLPWQTLVDWDHHLR